VITSFSLSFCFALYSIASLHSNPRRSILLSITSVTFTLWLISYLCAVFSSPGYVPFYWAVERAETFSYEQQMSGVITTPEQYDFANYNGRPERGSLSRQARRIVLRADHICPWIANWVGLKNYRWFFLKLIWATVYFINWFVVFALDAVEMAKDWRANASFIGMIVLALPAFGFAGFIVVMLQRHLRYSTQNTTTLQEFKRKKLKDKHNYYDLGCWRNCVELNRERPPEADDGAE
jgi:hypothetical protein